MILKTNKNYWMRKSPLEYKKFLDRVRLERIKRGKDKKMQPYWRIDLAITRHNGIFNDLINADFVEGLYG